MVFRTRTEDVSAAATIGSSQGSPLSPLLWNVLIHGLLETDFPEGVYVQAYAYDTVLVVSGGQRRELEHVANLALQTVTTWAESVRVRLNAEKCSYMLFRNGS